MVAQKVILRRRAGRNSGTWSWQLDFRAEDGQRKRISLGMISAEEAERVRADYEAKLIAGAYDPLASPPDSIEGIGGVTRLSLEGLAPGIYFLCEGKKIVYVGQSDCVLRRVVRHIEEREKHFDARRVFWVRCKMSNLDGFESRLIAALKPKYNKQPGRKNETRYARQVGSLEAPAAPERGAS